MTDTQQQPKTPEEQAQVDYGKNLIWRLVNSSIVSFGANDKGEIYLSTVKDGVSLEIEIAADDAGNITIYELERAESPASPEVTA